MVVERFLANVRLWTYWAKAKITTEQLSNFQYYRIAWWEALCIFISVWGRSEYVPLLLLNNTFWRLICRLSDYKTAYLNSSQSCVIKTRGTWYRYGAVAFIFEDQILIAHGRSDQIQSMAIDLDEHNLLFFYCVSILITLWLFRWLRDTKDQLRSFFYLPLETPCVLGNSDTVFI